MSEQLTGAQALIRALENAGVDTVFGIPGGAILPAYDPMLDSTQIRHILVRHEQGAYHAAQGYASATGKTGVCMATSGPGATNLVTPIADAYMDSVPLVAITGQVASAAIGTDAFQEADIRGITMPITKHNFLVNDPNEIASTIAEAFYIASTGRPGPVLVDVTKDAMQAKVDFQWPTELSLPGYRPVTRPHPKQVREAARLIVAAEKPVLYVGGGVIRAKAHVELKELAEKLGIPVVTTLMARGALPDTHELHFGMPGMHGSVSAVGALQRSDLLICLGARFDDRVTGKLSSFAPEAKVIHADIDPAEIGKNRAADVPIVGDCKEVIVDLIAALTTEIANSHTPDYSSWRNLLDSVKAKYPVGYDEPEDGSLSPQYVIQRIGQISRPGRDLHQRRQAAPDVGRALPAVREAAALAELRRPRHDGVLGARRDGRQGGPAGQDGVGDRRRRLLPDDEPGARHLCAGGHPDQGRGDQQPVAWHGPAVADAVLRQALLQHRPALGPDPGLRQAGRGDGLRRAAVLGQGVRGRHHREGDGGHRRAGGGRLRRAPRRDGLADGCPCGTSNDDIQIARDMAPNWDSEEL